MKILLATLHAKYAHASLALPCLAAACADLEGIEIAIGEWTVNEPHPRLLRQVVSRQADLVAFSCYIWNIRETLALAADLKKIASETVIVLGGPEASFGVFDLMSANPAIDFVVKGEGEEVFRRLLQTLQPVEPGRVPDQCMLEEIPNLFSRDGDDVVAGPADRSPLNPDRVPSPFRAGLVDLDKPLVYVETSRGCPFTCAFCMSSLEGKVRSYSEERIRQDLLLLMHHGVPQIKLVDRTFNYDAERANRIWRYILDHNRGSHFHFEIAADLLTASNMDVLRRVPADTFRFEIGVQSCSAETLERVGRRADFTRISENVQRLREETQVELHLDLLAGLPGEGYGGFLDSLQKVADLRPHVIQVEPLKVLKGSPMQGIAEQEGYRYSATPPYTILRNPWLSYEQICRIETIGRLLDLFHNSGGFRGGMSFMLERIGFGEIFDALAGRGLDLDLSGRSTRRVYELFADLADPLLDDQGRALLHDALFFDYCNREMPQAGRLPSFIADRQGECAWPGGRELPDGLDLPAGARVKTFRFPFLQNHTGDGAPCRTHFTFVYASASGQGLQIQAFTSDQQS